MRLSAIIPTFQEAAPIAEAVRSCRAIADEVIVADGGSTDGTLAAATAASATVITAPRGRGPQLNAGARAATGDVLLFVHADSRLPAAARAAIQSALADPRIVGGNFKLRFVPSTPAGEFYGWANHVRRRWLRIYYGDSCLFVRRHVFDELGGYRDIPLFEDHEFVRRLERSGPTHYETNVVTETSSRRFAARPLQTLALWGALQLAYGLGVSPHRLARWYAAAR